MTLMSSWMRFVALAACLLSAAPATAAILIVDCNTGPFFDINTAVTAAAPGDTVVVHVCTIAPFAYPPFSALGKTRVHVVGADVTAPAAMGGRRVGFGTVPLALFVPPVVVDGNLGTGSCARVDSSVGVSITGLRMINCLGAGLENTFSVETSFIANRVENSGNAIREAACQGSRIVGNMFVSFLGVGISIANSDFDLIADNQIGLSNGDGIALFSGPGVMSGHHVINNQVANNAGAGIRDNALESRIERNTVSGNGGPAQIVVDTGSIMADVIGNNTSFSILNLGAGTDLQDNQ